jgi:hypothetical protein
MRLRTAAIASALLAFSVTSQAEAQSFARCDVWQVTTKVVREKVGATASAGCDTGGGGIKSCSVNVNASQPNFVLDRNDTRNACSRLDGDNPCAFVQYSPIVFPTDTQANQSFTTNSDRVTVQLIIGQFKVSEVIDSEKITQPGLNLKAGDQFVVKRLRTAQNVRLECKKSDGGSFINQVPGDDNSGGHIKLVRIEPGGPYDYYVFVVSKK